jgi:hypothetical protein
MASYATFSSVVAAGASPPGSSVGVPGVGRQAVGSSAGVAVQTAKHDILILNQGAAKGSLGADLKLARLLAGRLG